MTIPTLIEGRDAAEILLDEIGAILATESAAQQQLAVDDGQDPRLWALRVFVGRDAPWEEYVDAEASGDMLDVTPIVNVSFDSTNFDRKHGGTVDRQKSAAFFHLDCYGCGVASDQAGPGHEPADLRANLEVMRCVRLVRRILMSAEYIYLGHRGTVWRRWIASIQRFQPPTEAPSVHAIVGMRITLEADFNEFAPQHEGVPLALISATVKRHGTGEIYFTAEYGA